jgi:hypothetical protein
MNDAITAENKISEITENQPIYLNWTDNLSIQELLDVVASIIADEYISIAKENPETFSK